MTISETGDRRGFTLLEILLVLALIALFGWIFIGVSSALLDARSGSPDEQFWQACAAARKMALEEQTAVTLGFDAKTRSFTMGDGRQSTATAVTGGPADLVIDFHPAQAASNSMTLVGGTLVEAQPISFVTFYPDGTCTPFRAQIRGGGGAHILAVDPWTCAPVLAKSDATP